jgi:pimeloyl-ACP methyl ester carboxylesterase
MAMSGAADVVFVHAAGTGGEAAWPWQVDRDLGRPATFLTRRGWDSEPLPERYTLAGEADWLATCLHGPAHVVAHSWSGVVALDAALRFPDNFASLVLAEPAALSIATEDADVRAHIDSMRPAYEPGISVEEFGRRFMRGIGGSGGSNLEWSDEQRRAMRRLQRHEPPWKADATARGLGDLSVPTLVVSSRDAGMYATIAAGLAESSTRVRWKVIDGPSHRPQDTEAFNDLAMQWWTSADRELEP